MKQSVIKKLSDEELAVNAQAGSHPCFEELVYRYSQRLFHFLRPKIATDQDTEDLVQDTFLKAYHNIARFDRQYKFSTWLYTTAFRLAVSYYRKKREHEPAYEAASSSPGPFEKMARDEKYQNLWAAAQTLKKNQYRVLWLRYMEDMPVKEIAGIMKKNQVHIRVLLHRARLNLVKGIDQPINAREEIEKAAPAERNLSFLL